MIISIPQLHYLYIPGLYKQHVKTVNTNMLHADENWNVVSYLGKELLITVTSIYAEILQQFLAMLKLSNVIVGFNKTVGTCHTYDDG